MFWNWSPRRSREPANASKAGRRVSLICVPIKLGEEVIGTLSVEREAEGTQHLAADRRLLSRIAAMAAQAAH